MNFKQLWSRSFYAWRVRIPAHILFWIVFFFLGTAESMVLVSSVHVNPYINLVGILLCILIFYPLVYGIIPLLIRKRFAAAIPAIFVWYILCVAFRQYNIGLILAWYNKGTASVNGQYFLDSVRSALDPYQFLRTFFSSLVTLLSIVMVPLTIKTIRYLYQVNEKRLTLEKEKLDLELHFMKAQINPHFLFNTLNNIQSFIIHGEKDKSIELISRLSATPL